MAGHLLKSGDIEDIPQRRLTQATCRSYGIKVAGDGKFHIYPYYDEGGELVAQKVRDNTTKDFVWKGDSSQSTLFGQSRFKAGGKRVIVTEGELDAASCYQTIDAKTKGTWAVVSIRNGAQVGEKVKKVENEIRQSFDYLNSFEEVVFCFDDDEAGQCSAKASAALFPPGKAFVTKLQYNDPSEYLQKGKSQELYKDLWNSPAWRPDGIVSVADVNTDQTLGSVLRYTSPTLTMKMLGRKPHTMTGLVSGTGSGKTTFVMQQTFQDLEDGVVVGGLFLEGSPQTTLFDLAGIRMGKRVRQIKAQRELVAQYPELEDHCEVVDDLDDEELNHHLQWLKSQPLHLLDHFGRAKPDEILKSIEYLSVGLGCQEIILDHISKVQVEDNKELDAFVDALQSMTKRLPSHITVVSQLNQGDGTKSHEEGKRTTLRDIRGSQVVVSSFDEILAFSRNQLAECDTERNTVYIDSLKNRLGGYTGFIESRTYDTKTGRLQLSDGGISAFSNESTGVDEPNFLETLT
jgi:twinkle protein